MATPQPSQLTIAVVGDVHDLWDADDTLALKHLGVDLVLLVGDFGNESVEVVRSIASLEIPKAAILGNHDAWYTASDWGRRKSPYDHRVEDRVQQQLDLLGISHVGYGRLDLPLLDISIVGGRPFSWGGSVWKNPEFYRERYGIYNFEESVSRIVNQVKDAACETVIFVGHCGPTGLGDRPEDPCGRDWQPLGGDYGDPDLADAIAQAHSLGKQIPLVAFGHMHHHLRHTKNHLRKMLHQDAAGTVYLNAASVPRIRETEAGRIHNFSLVTLSQKQVAKASLVWVDRAGAIASEQVLYEASSLTPQRPAQDSRLVV